MLLSLSNVQRYLPPLALMLACLLLPVRAQSATADNRLGPVENRMTAPDNRIDSAYSPGITGTHPPLSHRNQDTLSNDKLHQAPHTGPGPYHDSGRVMAPPAAGNPEAAPHNSQYSRNVNPQTRKNGPDSPYHDYNTTPKVKSGPSSPGSYGNSGQGLGTSSRPWRSY